MKEMIEMKNEDGDVKLVKFGLSWTCFFWGSCFGIPWFLRNLPNYGVAHTIILLFIILTGERISLFRIFLSVVAISFNIFGLLNANRLAIKKYYENGYKFSYPDSYTVAEMNEKYHIF